MKGVSSILLTKVSFECIYDTLLLCTDDTPSDEWFDTFLGTNDTLDVLIRRVCRLPFTRKTLQFDRRFVRKPLLPVRIFPPRVSPHSEAHS